MQKQVYSKKELNMLKTRKRAIKEEFSLKLDDFISVNVSKNKFKKRMNELNFSNCDSELIWNIYTQKNMKEEAYNSAINIFKK